MKNEKQNGTISNEQHELLMKERDRDSGGTQCRSDSDNRSHVSGLSSHPSHSSNSNSQSNSHTVSQSQSQRSHPSVGKTSLDRLYFPRHELQTMGILGKDEVSLVHSRVYAIRFLLQFRISGLTFHRKSAPKS